ncbi:MAG: MFS transporter, partial [Microthrixaceae bacterium]
FADRLGRRKVALASFLVAATLTVLTAAAPSLWAVGALQFFSRNLAIAGLLCADTIAVEEMPPGSRAMVSGLGALAFGLGAGIIVLTLPLSDLGTWGWRLTFVAAGLSLPLIWNVRKHLPESKRFEKLVEDRESVALAALSLDLATEPLAPLMAASQDSPAANRINIWRFAIVAAIFFLLNVFLAPASQLQNDYLRTEVGFSAIMITVFIVATTTPGAIGVLVGGRFADKHGRKITIIPGLLAIGIFNAIFFSVVGIPMWVASLLGTLIGGMAAPALGVIAPELFPTAHRGAVRGAVAALAVSGSVAGLLLAGPLIDSRGYGFTFALLAITPILAAIVACALPETRGKELEEINP